MNKNKTFLNLPQTKFSMRANLVKNEPKILNKWKKINLYKLINKNNKKITNNFFLHDGPPYANGNIHIGHAVNKILKDIILKFKRMSGFNAPFIPCWDCHGLPIEQQIEKKSINLNIVDKKTFRKICFQYTLKQIKKQKKDFIRLGILADWNNINYTMNHKNEANTIKILIKILKKGYIYQDFKPIYWCLQCQSSLAEAEIEYDFKKSISIYIKFQIKEKKELFKKLKINQLIENINNINVNLIIFTTTPWTLPTCQAIAINSNLEYQIIQYNNEYYICNTELINNVTKKIKFKSWIKICNFIGKKIENIKVLHPFLNITIPIILSKYVTNDLGTGIVQMSPDHGIEDFKICKKYNINPKKIINSQGYYQLNSSIELNNIHIFNKENIVIKLLKNKKKILHIENIKHSYPHCWRHKKPIIFRATLQWFIKTSKKKWINKILKKIQTVSWHPIWSKKRMKNMLNNRPDWCISRQRTWGVPIPFFIHKKTGKLHHNTISITKKIIKKIKTHGSEIWWKIDKKKYLGKKYDEYKKNTDTLDIWFESGSNHQLEIYKYNIKNKKNYVADLYLEGSDQYRGWFMSSLIISMITKKQVPYKKVITHGFVVDKNGKKMSKSLGNNITPQDIIKIWGADILRLWVAYTDYSNEISISNIVLQQIADHYRKIRNTIRFLLANIFDFNPKKNIISYKKMLFIDHWIIDRTYYTQKKIIKFYKKYKFHDAVQKIIYFCSIELGSKYLEIIKDRQYTMHKCSTARRSGQTTIYYILHSLVRWISPILSFTSDEIWSYLKKNTKESIFMKKWFKKLKPISKEKKFNQIFWKKIFLIRHEINKIIEIKKERKKIKNSLEIIITLYIRNKLLKILSPLCLELKFIFSVSQVKLSNYKFSPKNIKKNKNIKDLKIKMIKINGTKCQRCWHHIENTYVIKQHKYICTRCINNISGKKEKRLFV